MRASLKEILQKEQIMVIDGSMSTALEALGANLNNTLWTASVLKDRPELIRQVHYDYFKAGADAVGGCCTTSYAHIREVAAARETYLQAGKPKRIPY